MAAVSNMMPVSLPRFASASTAASTAKQKQNDAGLPSQTWSEGGGGGGDMDFDMLAEYLLEDVTGGTGLPAFDFSTETPPSTDQQHQAVVVSPEHMSTSFVDPLADAAAEMKKAGVPAAAPAPSVHAAGAAAAPLAVPAPLAAAAPPAFAKPINLSDITLAPASAPPATAVVTPAGPVVYSIAPKAAVPHPLAPLPIPAPAALAPAPVRMLPLPPPPNGFPQQPVLRTLPVPAPNAPLNKRRRVDAAAPIVAVATAAPTGPVLALNGQLLPQTFPQRGGRQKSQAQVNRRRERNRILARRTRLRKKFFFESIQKDVTDLQQENAALKEIVRTRVNSTAAKSILDECKAMEEMPSCVLEHCGVSTSQLGSQDFNLIQGVQKSQQSFVITDPSLQDNPIVYASDDFLSLTGYSREEVLGRNCRFLQGTETSPAKVAQIRKTVASGEDCTVTLINYTADGTAFWNSLFIAALRDAQNNIVNFIGVIVKVAGPDPSDPEAGKRLPGEVSPSDGLDQAFGDDPFESGPAFDEDDAAAVAEAAEGTVKAIEGVVTAALVTHQP